MTPFVPQEIPFSTNEKFWDSVDLFRALLDMTLDSQVLKTLFFAALMIRLPIVG